MNDEQKFSIGRHREQAAESQTGKTGELEFQNAEELIRHDAAQTEVPPEIARRLSESVAQTKPARRPWWRKLFG